MKPKFIKKFIVLFIILSWFPIAQPADALPRTGFLVLAPDRGFLGNREVKNLFKSFSIDYPASLAFIEREYGGPDRTYEKFLKESLEELRDKKLDRVVVISLFLTGFNPVVQDVHSLLENYQTDFALDWAEPMLRSYLISEILKDRVLEISRDPENETVLLVAHGARNDKRDKRWKDILQKHVDYIKKNTQESFKHMLGLTVREDWPKKHKKAVEEIRNFIKDASTNGRALIISNRLYGSGRYDEFFEGLDYEMNRKGLALHANMTSWLDDGIRRTLQKNFSLSVD